MYNGLNEYEVNKIKTLARGKLGEYRKSNDIIGTQIFSILGLCARVIYYPLGIDAPWGFTRMSGSANDAGLVRPFVVINTSIPVDYQVFAAAHELYHIWFGRKPDVLEAGFLEEEVMANRFAAEFLVDEMLLRSEMELYKIKKITVKSVLQLCEIFSVPYRTMARRLYETGRIDGKQLRGFLQETEESVARYCRIYSLPQKDSDSRMTMDNLPELAAEAYKKGLITFEKLEYLLGLSNLTPEDIAIEKAPDYEFPKEDIDAIMEE